MNKTYEDGLRDAQALLQRRRDNRRSATMASTTMRVELTDLIFEISRMIDAYKAGEVGGNE